MQKFASLLLVAPSLLVKPLLLIALLLLCTQCSKDTSQPWYLVQPQLWADYQAAVEEVQTKAE